MSSPSPADPSTHQQREQRFVEHVKRLLDDERLRVDTVNGAKPVAAHKQDVKETTGGDDPKRAMIEMGMSDRDLQNRMPLGKILDVTLLQKRLLLPGKPVGRLRVVCVSPTKQLLRGEKPEPMEIGDLNKLLGAQPPPLGGVPQTILVMSTSGFTIDAHEAADRRADRTVILVEPNDAGGWNVVGPTQLKALTDLLDPEREEEKRQRVREQIASNQHDLGGSGLASDRIAAKTQLTTQFVEGELKAYAKSHAGLVAKRLDGRVVLYREGATIAASGGGSSSSSGFSESGGIGMPLIDRIKSLFSRKGEEEKKISFLSERRTALSQQRDRAYEEMATLEQQEETLKRTFRETGAQITKKRVTTQLLQLRKDMERRHQLVGVLNQQINVVSTHLHNLELVRQGSTAQLPDAEEMTADALRAEEMLAELEAVGEVAGATTTSSSVSGMTAEEKALYDELEAEMKGATTASASTAAVPRPPIKEGAANDPAERHRAGDPEPPETLTERPASRRKAEPG
jgi:hypothetical protein